METNKQTEIISYVLRGIVEGVLSAREELAEHGALIATGNKPIEVEFHIPMPGCIDAFTNFKIPFSIPVLPKDIPGAEEKPVTPDTKISDTCLSTRIKNGLRQRDIETVRDLLAVTKRTDLLSIHQIGYECLRQIEDFLSWHGLHPEWADKSENEELNNNR
jgi:hypothetical protein